MCRQPSPVITCNEPRLECFDLSVPMWYSRGLPARDMFKAEDDLSCLFFSALFSASAILLSMKLSRRCVSSAIVACCCIISDGGTGEDTMGGDSKAVITQYKLSLMQIESITNIVLIARIRIFVFFRGHMCRY